ncbi:MAG: DUF1579 domain-containing protein [Rubricoccaceae bacterium]|nr:DUF1579 domain-containing protein [Rubricoccaceae bacterium]
MRYTLLFLAFCLTATLAVAQEEMDMEAMMAMTQPDEKHEFLHAFVGEWDYQSTMWPAPGAPPIESEGTANIEMNLGGRYLMGTHTGNMMGMPFEGRAVTGYDKASGRYLSTWIDNFGTGIMMFEGQVEDGKLVLVANYDNPMTGVTEEHKMVQWAEGDTYTMEYYATPEGGEETLSMRIVSTRAGD